MHLLVVVKILGLLLMLFSLSMLPPAAFGWYDGDGTAVVFLEAFAFILVAGAVCWLLTFRVDRRLRLREGFIIVSLFWTVLGLAGAVPLLLAPSPDLDLSV
ncbi:MAG: potassium transporter, partial [Proteobacteria bacterium SW_6_67_9]